MSEPSLPSWVPTEEEIVAMLREERGSASRWGANGVWTARLLKATAVAVSLVFLAASVVINVEYDQRQKLAAAQADYDTAVRNLESVYDQNRASARQLGQTVRDASAFVATALNIVHVVNGYVDADALTGFADHTAQLSDIIGSPTGEAIHSNGAPATAAEYRTAATVARLQTERDRAVLEKTQAAIDAVKHAVDQARGDIPTVAASVPTVAAALGAANREARRTVRLQLEQSAEQVQQTLTTGGDVPAALTTYGACARAVLDSAAEETGEPAISVVASVAVPPMPAKVAAIVASTPAGAPPAASPAPAPAPQPTPTVAPHPGHGSSNPPAQASAPPAQAAGSSTTPGPTMTAPAPPFAVTVRALGQYAPGCPHLTVIGGGFAYGPAGTSKQQTLNYAFRYDYETAQKSATAVAWTVYKCQVGNAFGKR